MRIRVTRLQPERALESTDSFFILPELGINQAQCEVCLCKFVSQRERPRNGSEGGTELTKLTVSHPKTVLPGWVVWLARPHPKCMI